MSFLATVGTVLSVLIIIGVLGALFGALLTFLSDAYKH